MTVNLEQAKRLWELGVRKKPLKYWGVMNEDYRGKPRIVDGWVDLGIYDVVYPAYNAEELIAMMQLNNRPQLMIVYDRINKWQVMLLDIHPVVLGDNITQALATRLIYDLENNIISLEEINK